MIHIYTGNGKGKTTASLGLALRASGHNLKVCIYQFLKPKKFLSGEGNSIKRIKGVRFIKFDHTHPMFECSRSSLSRLKKRVKKDFEKAEKAILSGKYDMVILDEAINLVDQNFISEKAFLSLLKRVPEKVELILTGRGDTSKLEVFADYITIMADKKHPFTKEKQARKGIEY